MTDGSWNFLAKAISVFSGFLYLFFVARFLGPEDFGRIIYLLTVIPGIGILFGLSALQDVIVNFGAKYRDKKLLNRLLIISFLSSLVLSLGIIALAFVLPSFFPDTGLLLVLTAVPALPLFVLYTFYYSVFQAFKKFGFLTKLVLFDNIINFVLVLIFLYPFHAGPVSVIWARLLTYVLDVILFMVFERRLVYAKSGDWDAKEIWDYSKFSFVNELPKQLPKQAVNWLLGAFAPAKLLGEYYFAKKIVSGGIDNVYAAIRETVYAYTNQHFKEKKLVKLMVSKSARICFLITGLFTIVLSFLVVPFLFIFFPSYQGSAPLVVLFSLASVMNTITITSTFFRTFNRMNEVVSLTILYSACLFLTSLLLIPTFGVYGLVLAELLSALYQYYLYSAMLARNGFKFSIVPEPSDLDDLREFFGFALRKLTKSKKMVTK